jgi:hypothetical protein
MAVQIVDDFGIWDDLGTVNPVFNNWLSFPDFTTSASGLLRLFFSSDVFDRLTFAYIRCLYDVGNAYAIGRWIRIYPKFEPELIIYPHPPEFQNLKGELRRVYQIKKQHRFRRRIGTVNSETWRINLQVANESIDENGGNSGEQADLPSGFFLNLL